MKWRKLNDDWQPEVHLRSYQKSFSNATSPSLCLKFADLIAKDKMFEVPCGGMIVFDDGSTRVS